jgi:hypothetical protein
MSGRRVEGRVCLGIGVREVWGGVMRVGVFLI